MIVVGQNMGAAAASSFALVLCFNGKSVVSVLTGWSVQRPNGRCAGSGPETAASACSSSLVLWVGASLSHLGIKREEERNGYPFNQVCRHSLTAILCFSQRPSTQCNVVCLFFFFFFVSRKCYMMTKAGSPTALGPQTLRGPEVQRLPVWQLLCGKLIHFKSV